MIILRWRASDRKAVADANAIAFVRKALRKGLSQEIEISNGLILLGFRAAVARGDIPAHELVFDLNGKVYEFTETGSFREEYPSSPVFSVEEGWLGEILDAGCKAHIRKRS